MQILESSRPIMKCEHFLILHFQVDISTQKQALGKISKFIAYVCVCVYKCASVCVCVCPCMVHASCVCETNCGFPLLFRICFSLAHWSNVCYC